MKRSKHSGLIEALVDVIKHDENFLVVHYPKGIREGELVSGSTFYDAEDLEDLAEKLYRVAVSDPVLGSVLLRVGERIQDAERRASDS